MTIDGTKWGGITAIAMRMLLGLTALHHHVYKQGYDADAAHVQQHFDAAKEAAEQKRLADVQPARVGEQRRTQAQAEIANDATKQAATAAANATAAGAADGLRAGVARLVAAAGAAGHSQLCRHRPGPVWWRYPQCARQRVQPY